MSRGNAVVGGKRLDALTDLFCDLVGLCSAALGASLCPSVIPLEEVVDVGPSKCIVAVY